MLGGYVNPPPMRKDEEVPPELREEVVRSLPDLNGLSQRVSNRMGILTMPLLSGDHVGLSWICLSDAAYLIQDAIVALRESKLDWHWALGHYEKNTLLMAVGEARYSLDYAVNLMVSASNHLSAAMWHFHETAEEPLDRYDAMSTVVKKWKKRDAPPAPLAVLEHLAASASWKVIVEYRHKWVHRGIPVIRGEFRHAKGPLWTSDTKSAATSIFRMVRPDGMVSHPNITMTPEYEMTDLLERGTAALHDVHQATDKFVDMLDERITADGWEIEDGKLRRSL